MTTKGFTLMEVLIAILIIGVLIAIGVPQYQKAVLKSRFSTLMPMAKSVADAQEIFYLSNGYYAQNDEKDLLDISPVSAENSTITLSTDETHDYVLAQRNDIPQAHYIIYQKKSRNFPQTTWCEAGDEQAQALCISLGGVIPEGITGNTTGTDGWTAYLLSGQARAGDSFSATPSGIAKMTPQQAQAIADEKCANPSYGCVGIPNDDGTVSVCETRFSSVNETTGECVATNFGNFYEKVYDASGTLKEKYSCKMQNMQGECAQRAIAIYDTDGSYTVKHRKCADDAVLSKEGVCSNGEYDMNNSNNNMDYFYPSDGKSATGQNLCNVGNAAGICTEYSQMDHLDNTYSGDTLINIVVKRCVSISQTTCKDNNYQPILAQNNTSSTLIRCFDSSGKIAEGNPADGTCPSGYSWQQRQGNTYTPCSSYESIHWENATCS